MISSSNTSSAESTNRLRTLQNQDSRAPTQPVGPRPFNGELPTETSGKRVRPDATVRGIGPNSASIDACDRSSPTLEVRSSELECLSEVHSETGELQIPWMRNDFKFVLAVGGGAFLLVLSMLMVMSRSSESEPASHGKATITTGALGDSSPVLNAKAPEAEAVPAQESEPFVPAQVKPLLAEQEAEVAEPVAAKKPAKTPARTSKGARAKASSKTRLSAQSKVGTRTSAKSKKVSKRARVGL
jgi:hypothetical protein